MAEVIPIVGVKSPLLGPKILLEGPSGTGKTFALRTLAAAGIKPFILTLDPGYEVLGDTDPKTVAWKYIAAPNAEWASMIESSNRINTLQYDTITKMADPNRTKFRRYIQILETLANFTDDRTGEKFGPVDSWGTGRAIVIDHFTEVCKAAMELTIGEKPVANQPEWQLAQNNTEALIRKLCQVTRCWFILIAHIEREVDEVLGGSKIMTSALGKKLAPKLPALFSDVILSQREIKKFSWSTVALGADLKTRNLPLEENIPQDFGQIVAKWRSRGGIIET